MEDEGRGKRGLPLFSKLFHRYSRHNFVGMLSSLAKRENVVCPLFPLAAAFAEYVRDEMRGKTWEGYLIQHNKMRTRPSVPPWKTWTR